MAGLSVPSCSNGHYAHGASPHSTAAPEGAMATSPNHAHRFPNTKQSPPGAAKLLRTHVNGTVKGKTAGLAGLVNGKKNGSRAREETCTSPIQVSVVVHSQVISILVLWNTGPSVVPLCNMSHSDSSTQTFCSDSKSWALVGGTSQQIVAQYLKVKKKKCYCNNLV